MQGLTAETRLPQLCDELKEVLTSLVGHLPQAPKKDKNTSPEIVKRRDVRKILRLLACFGQRKMSSKRSWRTGPPSQRAALTSAGAARRTAPCC